MARGTGSLTSLAKRDRARNARASALRLLGYLRPHKRRVIVAFAWLVISSLNTAASPAITGWIVDTAIAGAKAGGRTAALALPIVALFVSTFAGWYSQRMQILVLGTVGQEALFELRGEVFDKVQDLSVAFFETAESGDIMSRLINDIEQVNSFLAQGFRRVLGALLGFTATLVGMALVSWRLALVTLLVVPVMYVASWLFGSLARRVFRRRQETIGDVSASLAEDLAGIRVAQAFVRTERNRGEFAERNATNRDANIAASAVSAAFPPVLAVISAASTALVAGYGGFLAAGGMVTVGVVVAFFGYSRSFFNAVSQLSSLWAETQSALAGGERVFDLLDTPPEVTDAPDAIDLGAVRGEVCFEHVRFSYGTGGVVLDDIDLHVEAGTTLAIVGPTGAGKSTMINLLARFYDPTGGRVLVDGTDLRAITLSSLRSNLGVVLQDPFLFSGTIAENIRYGRLDASDDDVRAAAEASRASTFIDRLADGYDTPVGERGVLLSTGQRQLIAFARAVLSNPAILVLDEATSSVDTRTEILIQEALADILHGRTAFVIAHRLSTIRDADRIVVVDHGAIVEDGTYAELLVRDGLFARLHAAQFSVD
ncbi:MAG: ABC transporter ATP-binding protein [Actinobacteria bacterium HGW-Actinobacteria-1]|nr:MAG: ABC transporter ATP-binding protein [Actinobacteria bacterium HGW-Actinobacteria-1]